MIDEWETELFEATFDGLSLSGPGVALRSTRDRVGRDVVVTVYPRRDGGHVDDQGQQPRESTWEILFYATPGQRSHVERFQEFVNALQTPDAKELVHPLTGAFQVKVGDVSFDGDAIERNQIPISVTFIEHEPEPALFELTGGSITSSREEVQAAVDAVRVEAAIQGLDEPAVTSAVEVQADTWESSSGSLTASSISLQMNDLANEIEAYAGTINVATDLSRQPMLVALFRMRDSLDKLAQAAIFAAPRLYNYITRETMPLMAICSELYGGEKAAGRYGDIIELNRIPSVLRVPAGTVLKVPEAGG